ncbi:Neurotactin like protein [Argiope bruennichi]|uniref:Neurotactin like protein n=1 Tax=Argiope bruennichi TaxID=94029 RepID=A0A8T0FBQ5_ARGBR|nr:Neurotactin like protein [Argiope bruennichi]
MRGRPCELPFCISWENGARASTIKEEARGYGRRHLFKVYVPRLPRYVVALPIIMRLESRESIGRAQYGEWWIHFADEYYDGNSWLQRPGSVLLSRMRNTPPAERFVNGLVMRAIMVTVLAHGGAATAGLALLSSRLSAKKEESLFSQMWLTGPSARFSNRTLEQISADNSGILRKLNCDTLVCLQNKTSEEIVAAVPGFWSSDWSIDLPSSEEEQQPTMVVVDEGDIQQVPVVIGSVAQESGSSKVLHDLEKWSWTDFSDYVSEKLETISDNVTVSALQFYIQNSSTPLQQFHTMVSDIRTICPIERLTDALGDALQKDSYWYLVDYKPSEPIQFSNESASVKLSVHGLDVAAIFGLLNKYIKPMAPQDVTFQKNLQDLFYSFVHKGRPELKGEILMPSNFINLIGESVRSRMTPYENCHLWNNDVLCAFSLVFQATLVKQSIENKNCSLANAYLDLANSESDSDSEMEASNQLQASSNKSKTETSTSKPQTGSPTSKQYTVTANTKQNTGTATTKQPTGTATSKPHIGSSTISSLLLISVDKKKNKTLEIRNIKQFLEKAKQWVMRIWKSEKDKAKDE